MNLDEVTKAELLDMIAQADQEIDALKNVEKIEAVPEHDFYRACMWLECISCGNRWVDGPGCGVCRPGKEFLQKYRSTYAWKSDDKERDPRSHDKIRERRTLLGLPAEQEG
jgi:hypothetical protein